MQDLSVDLARSVLDAAPDAMIVIDEAGIIRFANRQVSALFGYSRDEIVGQAVERLMPDRFRDRHVAHRHGYAAARRMRPMGVGLALFGRHKDGSEFPVEISLSPVRDSTLLVAAAIRDITDRRRAEAELTAAREAAERAREAADRANQAKGRFLATASHDLRQPLQTLALLNGSLRRMIIHENADEALLQQEQAIGAMSRLLNALLDISKLESGAIKPELTDFPVDRLFESLRREFATIAATKGLELQFEPCEECAFSDPGLVEQILKNLVSNAIKYTPHGQVRVRAVRQDSLLRIEVHDTGIGIPADQIAYIYDEFYQVGVPTNTSRQGYGLGLSIVQRQVRLLNARVEVISEVGRGSIFTLILATGTVRHAANSAAPAKTKTGTAQTARRHVLLVEDDPAVRAAAGMLLSVEGYRVTAVGSLPEALGSLGDEETPQLMITDYHLDNGELGTQVIAAVRERLGTAIGAVLVTGDTSAAIKEIAGDAHLRIASKPINADELLSLLDALLIDD
jgi:PAS domain S-box-containing protein